MGALIATSSVLPGTRILASTPSSVASMVTSALSVWMDASSSPAENDSPSFTCAQQQRGPLPQTNGTNQQSLTTKIRRGCNTQMSIILTSHSTMLPCVIVCTNTKHVRGAKSICNESQLIKASSSINAPVLCTPHCKMSLLSLHFLPRQTHRGEGGHADDGVMRKGAHRAREDGQLPSGCNSYR